MKNHKINIVKLVCVHIMLAIDDSIIRISSNVHLIPIFVDFAVVELTHKNKWSLKCNL